VFYDEIYALQDVQLILPNAYWWYINRYLTRVAQRKSTSKKREVFVKCALYRKIMVVNKRHYAVLMATII